MLRLLQNATLIDSDGSAERADLLIDGARIAGRLPTGTPPPAGASVTDVAGRWILPGFAQPHIHLVQTLFRGLADDLPLMDWLRRRIWPLEAAHDSDSVYWSARLGVTELLLGGTTAVLDMATVAHTDRVFEAAAESGIRAFIGKAMMDRENPSGLYESTDAALASACDLADRWHGRGRLGYAFSPRFVPSCTGELLSRSAEEARRRGCLLHTHASENTSEIALVRELTGTTNIAFLDGVGFSGPDVVLAHCVHLAEGEPDVLARTDTTVAHCPSSNLKLASGIAPIPDLLRRGVRCTLGADGAPCNNRLDMFTEMRLAALIQKPIHGADEMPARTVLRMATADGADALGLKTGRLLPGRLADLVIIDPDVVSGFGGGDPASAVVYALTPAAIREVWIGGEPVVADGAVIGWDTEETIAGCRAALARVRERALGG